MEKEESGDQLRVAGWQKKEEEEEGGNSLVSLPPPPPITDLCALEI